MFAFLALLGAWVAHNPAYVASFHQIWGEIIYVTHTPGNIENLFRSSSNQLSNLGE